MPPMRPGLLLGCLLLLCTHCLAGCGESQPAAPEPREEAPGPPVEAPDVPDDAPLVVFLGDSLAAGMGLSADRAFPAVLQRRLAEDGLPFRLVNAGVSGNTTGAGLARVDWVLGRKPDVVVVELGANDGFRGLPLDATEKNLREIIAKVEAAGATVLLLGMKLPPNYGADYTRDFDALFARVAEETDVAFVPFFMDGVAGVASMNQGDGIHPTARGHEALAANLRSPVAKVLRDLE